MLVSICEIGETGNVEDERLLMRSDVSVVDGCFGLDALYETVLFLAEAILSLCVAWSGRPNFVL